jgi:Na+-translocating ferredoxin:NAD+ oxidoreductase subunit E
MTPVIKRVAPLLLLCPLLAVSDSLVNALGLCVVTLLVTTIASLPMSLTLQRLPEYGRIAAVVVITAGTVTSALLIIHAWFYALYLAIGAYIPLLVAAGLMITRYDVVTPHSQRTQFVFAGLRTGLYFCVSLLSLGAVREFVGHGSLFFGAEALPGEWTKQLSHPFFSIDYGFVLASLPPGAFIAMGILAAIRNWYVSRRSPVGATDKQIE